MESMYNTQNMSSYLPKAIKQLKAASFTSRYKGITDVLAKSREDPQQFLDFIKKMKT